MHSIGKTIKERRIELGLSQGDLSKKIGRDRSTIAKIESGAIGVSADKIKEFAEALETTEAHLMGWDEGPPPIPDVLRLTAPPETVAHMKSMLRDYEEIGPEAVEKTVEIMEKLNATGKMKVYEYARDLEDSGNYK